MPDDSEEVLSDRKVCEKFAIKHKLIFEDEGECGIGRECVGFLSRRGNYVDYNPMHAMTYDAIKGLQSDQVYAPEDVDAYHKHDCMAVLGRGDKAIGGLARWVKKLEETGNVRIVEYSTGATGPQAIFSGVTGYAVMVGA